jgi:hypothetical protein
VPIVFSRDRINIVEQSESMGELLIKAPTGTVGKQKFISK